MQLLGQASSISKDNFSICIRTIQGLEQEGIENAEVTTTYLLAHYISL